MSASRERILVTVRTYPVPSTGYRETVCVAGVTREREWRRLYPVLLRYLPDKQQFKTWDIIEVDVRPAVRDHRPESRRVQLPTLQIVGQIKVNTPAGWADRRDWISHGSFASLSEMIQAERSIGSVRVAEVLDITFKKRAANWDPARKAKLEQMMLFDKPLPLEKIPVEFRFTWRDEDDARHDSLVISWEMAQAWRQYRKRYGDNAERKIKDKLLDDYFSSKRHVEFFMGNHSRFRETFMVCGWFIPPKRAIADDNLW